MASLPSNQETYPQIGSDQISNSAQTYPLFMFLSHTVQAERKIDRILAGALLLLSLATLALPHVFASGTGSVTISTMYGDVHGQLQNGVLQNDNSITMSMVINDQIQGQPVKATGTWTGALNGQSMSGTIQNFVGSIGDAQFTGQATWTGTLTSTSDGAGNLTGTITITSSPYPQFPQGNTYPISGTWTASFTNPVPEFSSGSTILLTLFIAISVLAFAKRERQ